MAADVAGTLLNTAEFAEWVTYYPATGGVSHRLVALISNEAARQDTPGPVRRNVETVRVFLLNDPTHAKGGVATPAHSERGADSFLRDSDPTGGRYVFTGRVYDSDAVSWTLEFERPKLRTVGTEHRGG